MPSRRENRHKASSPEKQSWCGISSKTRRIARPIACCLSLMPDDRYADTVGDLPQQGGEVLGRGG
jgi:hypothetical protein